MKRTSIASATHLARLTGKPTVTASDMITAQWVQQGFVVSPSTPRSLATKFSIIGSEHRGLSTEGDECTVRFAAHRGQLRLKLLRTAGGLAVLEPALLHTTSSAFRTQIDELGACT